MPEPTVLVVDDNEIDRERIRRLLGPGYVVLEASTAGAGVDAANESQVDCVLLDYRLPDRDGLDALPTFVARFVPVVLLTAQGNEDIAVEAMKLGASDYLSKAGLDRNSLTRTIVGALQQHSLRKQIRSRERELRLAVGELEQRRAELEASNRALSEREAQLHVVLEQLPALVWTADSEARITSIAGTPLQTMSLGSGEWVGRPCADLLGGAEGRPGLEAAVRRALAGADEQITVTWEGRTFECNLQPFRAPGAARDGVIGVGLDVTEPRRVEQRLQHAARLESLGQLSSGIAHDFNNVLTAIIGFARLASHRLPPGDRARGDMDQVLRAADRATQLVRQLLTFSRQDPGTEQSSDLRDVVSEVVPMLRRVIGEDVQIDIAAASKPLPVRIDPGRLEQVLVNLAVNARDAMSGGGRIRLETALVDTTKEMFGARGIRLPPGRHVTLTFADDGPGIPPDIVEHVFEAFFTTKDPDQGTGLGLNTVARIVQQSGGIVTVDSVLGKGTSFRIWLPAASEGAAPRAAAGETRIGPTGGDELVLVVEDEDAVRTVTVRMLESLGYQVLTASDGEAALGVLAAQEVCVDLVLTDVGLPNITGPQLASKIRQHHPDADVIFMSGYADSSLRARRSLPEGEVVLEKPLTLDVLATRVRSLLDERARRRPSSGGA